MIFAALFLAIAPAPVSQPTLDQVLDAIQIVETGGMLDAGDAVGDGGRSIGPFQIQRAYWLDSGVSGRYEDCRDAAYSRTVVKAYWKRWCPQALASVHGETLARIHNGGPRAMYKSSTKAYWRKVSDALERVRLAR